MAKRALTQKQLDRAIEAKTATAFNHYGNRRQYNMFDLSKIMEAGRVAAHEGRSIDEAVRIACDKYDVALQTS